MDRVNRFEYFRYMFNFVKTLILKKINYGRINKN